MTVDVTRPVQCQLRPDMLQTLRNLQDKVMFRTCASLRGSIKIVGLLVELNEKLSAKYGTESAELMQQELLAYGNRLGSHLSNAEGLNERIEATIGLVSTTLLCFGNYNLRHVLIYGKLSNLLDLRNQQVSDEINRGMLQLTREGVDDNATVRVITVFTLIYLPASFIAVSNYFSVVNRHRRTRLIFSRPS